MELGHTKIEWIGATEEEKRLFNTHTALGTMEYTPVTVKFTIKFTAVSTDPRNFKPYTLWIQVPQCISNKTMHKGVYNCLTVAVGKDNFVVLEIKK